jgi:hypothetical protein
LGKLLGPSWRKLDNDVNGEWGYFLVLDEFLQTPNDSKRFAAGWAGDRYLIYEGPKPGDVLMVQLTVWDTEADAQEFKDAYSKRTAGRYPGAKLIEAQTPGNAAEPQVWETAEGLVLLELRGKRVLIVEGVPDEVNAKALIKLLWE